MASIRLEVDFLISKLTYWLQSFLISIKFPVCHGYQGPCLKKGKKRRRNTAYVNDHMNFTFQCQKCYDGEAEYWKERWDEYYSSRF